MLLKVSDIHASYGEGAEILKGISLDVERNEVVSILGANGSGKTTLVRGVAGLLQVSTGMIEFDGRRIERKPAYERVKMGISMCAEGRKLFPQLKVSENLRLGAYLERDRENVRRSMENCYELFPVLGNRKKQLAGTLSGGEQQMLALSRALMSKPLLLILDEPTLGLAPKIIDQIYKAISRIAHGMTLLLVEQNASMALGVSTRGYVLETGSISLRGTADQLRANPRVRDAYLGG